MFKIVLERNIYLNILSDIVSLLYLCGVYRRLTDRYNFLPS